MTYLELVTRLQSESGAGGNPITSFTGARGATLRLINWIAEADLILQRRWQDWKFLWSTMTPITTGIGASDYAGDDDLGTWERDSLRIDGQQVEVLDYDPTLAPSAANGRPHTIYILPNDQLRLYPTPDAAYTVTGAYFREAQAMADETDTSLIPAKHHSAILWQALWLYANFENAAESKVQAQEMLALEITAMEGKQLKHQQAHKQANAGVIVVRPE